MTASTDQAFIVRCAHRNILGCPNHGAYALRMARNDFLMWREKGIQVWVVAPRAHVPIPFSLTDKGRAVNRGEV
jgi:1,2-phenylacetyl-CoA epoxidase PaaB subunit